MSGHLDDHNSGEHGQPASSSFAFVSSASSASVSTIGSGSSSSNTLPSTPGSGFPTSRKLLLEKFDQTLHRKLQASTRPRLITHKSSTGDDGQENPYALWECGFGFLGDFERPDSVPVTQAAFLTVANAEVESIHHIHDGFTSYIKAICSGEYYDFNEDFLSHQSHAAAITKAQLEQVAADIGAITTAVGSGTDTSADGEVGAELIEAFRYAQLWTRRTRAILVAAHVFYKINYVLGSDKKRLSAA